MPIYEYLCAGCGARFEAIRRMSERTNAPACPKCGEAQTSLALSASAFLGGGSGGGGSCSPTAWTGGG